MTLGPVRVMGVGVVVTMCVEEVSGQLFHITNIFDFVVFCSLLGNPNNGKVNCSLGNDRVPSYGDTCSFTCNSGYELTSNVTRMCQSDGSWNGDDLETTDICRQGITYKTVIRTLQHIECQMCVCV